MNKQLITIAGLVFSMVSALVYKKVFNRPFSHAGVHLYWMFMSISALVVFVLCINQLVEGRRRNASTGKRKFRPLSAINRRRSYRVTYPVELRPVFIVNKIDKSDSRTLEFKVVDISEDGIRLANDGSLGKAAEIGGKIQFYDGETKPIECSVIRQDSRHICAEFKTNLAWSTLLNEQRRMIASLRNE